MFEKIPFLGYLRAPVTPRLPIGGGRPSPKKFRYHPSEYFHTRLGLILSSVGLDIYKEPIFGVFKGPRPPPRRARGGEPSPEDFFIASTRVFSHPIGTESVQYWWIYMRRTNFLGIQGPTMTPRGLEKFQTPGSQLPAPKDNNGKFWKDPFDIYRIIAHTKVVVTAASSMLGCQMFEGCTHVG